MPVKATETMCFYVTHISLNKQYLKDFDKHLVLVSQIANF